MPRKKKVEPLTGLPNEDSLLVEKSRPLFGLWRSELTLPEFKILDVYLSRIDPHKPERRQVRFERGEIEYLLGVDKINMSDLRKRISHLGTMVPVGDVTDPRKLHMVSLFEEAKCNLDKNGLWQVDLECTTKAMQYIFNVDEIGYLRYKLRAITSLKSRYAYILFLYLESNRWRNPWKVSLDDLRTLLKADKTYAQEYKLFRRDILERAHREIEEKTGQRFTYTPIRQGRKVTAIEFCLKTLPKLDVEHADPNHDPQQYTLEGYLAGRDTPGDTVDYLASACSKDGKTEWTRREAEEIAAMLATMPDDMLPGSDLPIEQRRYNYLSLMYATLNRAAERNKIPHRFGYFRKIVEKDIAERTSSVKPKAKEKPEKVRQFNDFPQREYSDEFFNAYIRGDREKMIEEAKKAEDKAIMKRMRQK